MLLLRRPFQVLCLLGMRQLCHAGSGRAHDRNHYSFAYESLYIFLQIARTDWYSGISKHPVLTVEYCLVRSAGYCLQGLGNFDLETNPPGSRERRNVTVEVISVKSSQDWGNVVFAPAQWFPQLIEQVPLRANLDGSS